IPCADLSSLVTRLGPRGQMRHTVEVCIPGEYRRRYPIDAKTSLFDGIHERELVPNAMHAVFGPPRVVELDHFFGVPPNYDICLSQAEIIWVAFVCISAHLSFNERGVISAVCNAV